MGNLVKCQGTAFVTKKVTSLFTIWIFIISLPFFRLFFFLSSSKGGLGAKPPNIWREGGSWGEIRRLVPRMRYEAGGSFSAV